uniref:Malic enzyme n=2 Tax=Clastoptera arizonana TaxID=38151 RepID=A0A1B6D4E5_9HEMI
MNKKQLDIQRKYYVSNYLQRGIDHLRIARLNKGLGFKIAERQALGFHGLLPPAVWTQKQLVEHSWNFLNRKENNFEKYIYLMELLDINLKLFHQLVYEHIEDIMPLIYRPTINQTCPKFHYLTRFPKGLYISLYDEGNVYKLVKNWPSSEVRAIILTDGERALESEDAGALGMCLPTGKSLLYTTMAGVKPVYCLPVLIDVGTNSQEQLNDKFYVGINKKRVTGKIFEELVDEFMRAAVRCFGPNVLIQFDGFSTKHNFLFLNKFKNDYCVFNDDIESTGAAVLSGIVTASKIVYPKNKMGFISYNCFVLVGAGSANLGNADVIVEAMKAEGLTEQEAIDRIFILDSKGLIVKSRHDLNVNKRRFAKDLKPMKTIEEVLKLVRPTVLIGATGAGELFTSEMIKDMAKYNKLPVVISISRPESEAELTAENAYKYANGKILFAGGSNDFPITPVTHRGKTYYPKQAHNSHIFPGIVLGATAVRLRFITTEMFFQAAKIVSKYVTKEEMDVGSLYPSMSKIKEISLDIAVEIAKIGYRTGMALHLPEPKNIKEYILNEQYRNEYVPSLQIHPWGEEERE